MIRLQHHAYVSVIDCIAHILAHGLDLDTINAGRACGRDNDTAAVSSQFPAFEKNRESQHCRDRSTMTGPTRIRCRQIMRTIP